MSIILYMYNYGGIDIIYTNLTGVGSSSKSSGEGDLGSGQVGTSCILALLSIRLNPYLQNEHKLQYIDWLGHHGASLSNG